MTSRNDETRYLYYLGKFEVKPVEGQSDEYDSVFCVQDIFDRVWLKAGAVFELWLEKWGRNTDLFVLIKADTCTVRISIENKEFKRLVNEKWIEMIEAGESLNVRI